MQVANENNKCFIVWSNDIRGRFDPQFLRYKKQKNNYKFALAKLNDLLKEKPQYGANEVAVDGNPQTDIRYIRITDIDEFGNLKKDSWQTVETIKKKYLLEENDLLFARSGATAGKTFLYKKEFGKAIFAGYLIKFKINEQKANPKFIFYYTQLEPYIEWVKSIQRPSGQPNINSEEFKEIRIPLPDLETQNKIVEIMQSAYDKKSEKEKGAENILNSINNYILEELEIKMPEAQDKECFCISSQEVDKGRIDCYYYQPKFKEAEKSLKKSKYQVELLKNVSEKVISGQRPKGGVSQIKQGIPSLGGEHILTNGLIKTTDLKFIPLEYHEEHIENKIQEDDILIVKDGATTGKVGIVSKEYPYKEANINEHLFLLRSKTNLVNPYFLMAFLKSYGGQIQIERGITGGTITGIIREVIENIKIVIPPLEIQNRIAEEVKKRMIESEQLKLLAKNEIEKAKQEVEKIILGK